MANLHNTEVVGKTIKLAERVNDKSAVISLEDGTVIRFETVDQYDPMLGSWSVLKVDVVGT